MGNAARRRGETDIDGLDRAVDAIEAKPQRARADIVAHQHMHEILHEPAGARDDRLRRDDRLERIMQAVIDRRRDDGDERLVDAAERLVETAQEFGGKTRGKRRARLVDQRADGFEAEPAQRGAGFRRQPQGSDRQVRKRRGFLARGQNKQRRLVKARHRPGGAGRGGHRKPCRQPETAKPGGKIGDESFLAAEQMR